MPDEHTPKRFGYRATAGKVRPFPGISPGIGCASFGKLTLTHYRADGTLSYGACGKRGAPYLECHGPRE